MSRITVGLSAASERSKSSAGGSPSADTPPFHAIAIGAAGEKPSAAFQPAGSVVLPSALLGSVPSGIARRRPVGVVGSSTSNAELGHGVMQWPSPSGLHGGSTGKLGTLLHAASASASAAGAMRRCAEAIAVEAGCHIEVTLHPCDSAGQ